MIRPSFIKKGDTLGMVAVSFGILDEPYLTRYNNAKAYFISQGFKIKEAKSVYTNASVYDYDGKNRALEFMDTYLDEEVDILFSVGGGEVAFEMLDYIDFEKLKMAKPKYFMGYSDNTNITFLLATLCGVESIYCINATAYGKYDCKFISDHFDLITKNKLEFESYDYYEDDLDFNLEVEWIGNADMYGMLIGGCLEVLQNICGTRYDNMKQFNENHNNIIFYFDVYNLNPCMLYNALLQFKRAGWFNKTIGFVFGRTINNMDFISYEDAINRALKDLDKPIIINADLGHILPSIPFINGRNARITVGNKKGRIIYDK